MHVKAVIALLVASVLTISEAQKAHAQFLYTPQTARELYRSDTLSICILGDMMMHSAQIADAEKHGYLTYFRHLKDRISSADIAIANMEYTHGGEPYTGYPAFSAPESYSRHLAECGFDIFLCANNHILDKGSKGAERTLHIYRQMREEYGIRYCGAAYDAEDLDSTYPLFVTAKGIRTALINFTYGTNIGSDSHWPRINYMRDTSSIRAALMKSAEADFTLVLPHWGTEYELTHSKQQEETARWLAENGADMIIGAHPHVVQDCQTIDSVPVVYSLGNAVSNMSAPDTQIELMADIRIVRRPNGDIEVLPVDFTWLWCSRPGGYCDSYCVLPVEEFLNRKDEWKGQWDYDKMVTTYERVRKITGINTK
jgi:poly-gamma-glutamate synthesis protein (capsule biosynthesis protein)